MQENTAQNINPKINLNTFTREELNNINLSTYENENYFQLNFKCEEFVADIQAFSTAFQQHILRILLDKKIINEPVELEFLHQFLSDELKAYDFAHGVNPVSTFFYETDDLFNKTYIDFIRYIRSHWVKEAFYFQATPTIRIHCPNAMNADLYPRYHTDICYGHPPEEVNIWIPLTKKLAGHGFSLLSLRDSKKLFEQFDYNYPEFIQRATHDRSFSDACKQVSHPAAAEFGEALLFDPRCIHSGEPLVSHTRISMDLRVIPVQAYNQMNIQHQGSGRLKILFEPGQCYHSKNSDTL